MLATAQRGMFTTALDASAVDLTSPESLAAIVEEIRVRLRPVNIVSFSGGKDSTVVLRLVLEALQGHPEHKLYIVTADTMMEIPYFQKYVDRVRDELRDYISTTGLNAEVVTVKPPAKHSFWVSVLGMGYPAAHMGFRWCTGKLKIDPITKFTRSVTAGEKFAVFVGVRSAESELRARIYKHKDYKPHHFAPVLDWGASDVWAYLMGSSAPWGDHSKLIEVYRYSSDECVYGEKEGACVGNARYGCWACPLQKSSQLDMIAYSTEDSRYQLLKKYKETLSGMANKAACRSVIRRNGQKGLGPFVVKIRKRLFADLMELEKETGWELITPEEIEVIKRHWSIDHSVHNIADNRRPMLWNLTEVG